MKIAFNPSTVAALTSPPNNKDITFDLKGHNIFARGVEFKGTDTNTWRPVVDNLISDSTTNSLSAKQGKVLKALIDGKSNSGHTHDDRYLKLTGGVLTGNLTGTSATFSGRFHGGGDDEGIIIKPASNGYAGLTLGAHDGERSVFYFTKGNPFWRYNNGSANLDIKHPKKAGTIALTSDIPNKGSWNYDDRYLRLSGGTMNSDALITFADSGSWGTDKGPLGARGGLRWTGQSDSIKLYAEETAVDNLDLVIQFGDDNSNGLSVRNKTNTQTSYISASGVITTGTFKGNLDWSYITNKPSSYTPSAHTHAWNSLTHSSTTANQAILTNGSANGWKLYTLNIAAWDNAASKAHSHSNKAVIDGITSTHVSNWNTAYNFVNNITKADTDKVINKWDEIVNFLAGIDSNNKLNTLLNSKLSVYELADKTNVGAIKNNGIYYSTTDASSSTLTNSPFSNGFALINMTSYDGGDDLRRSRLAFNAYGEIKVSDDRSQSNTTETWYNVLTSKNSGINGSTIKLNGSSITVYSSGTADGRYVKKSGDTMTGALNFANGTWNLVGDDSYMGDCNVSGHFGIKAANTTYPGIAFFNNANAHLGSLTAYSGNIKYGAYSLQFLDNGNTSVGASTWTNPFSAYDKDAVKDGQAICVWGQSSRLSNLSTDYGDMSLWLKRVNAKAATLNMVLDGEYYANGTQRLAHISEIPSSLKNPYALTISLNGTSQGPYDGSAAKSINITPGSIGAATSGHNHDGRYVYNYGGTQMDGASRNKNALGMSTTSGISGDWWHILQAAWNDEYRWNSQIAFPTQNRNGMYYRSGLDDNTKWGAWVKLLDSNNYNTFHHLLTNGNTTVSTSTWTNPFSAYNKNAIADGQAICVWGQNSRKYSDNEKFSTDTGDMSLWLKRVNANAATLNMVLDGEYYANGNQRLAHVSEIPNKNSWNYDDRYLKLTGGTLKGQIILPDIDVNTSYTGSIIIGASNTENLGIDGNEIMARNNGKASTLYLNNEGGAVQLGAILRTNSNIAYIGSQSTRDMIKFINNTNDPYGNGIAIGGGGLTIIGGGGACDVIAAHYNVTSETMHVGSDSSLYLYSNLDGGWNNRKTITFDTNGFTYFPSYINIGGNENNNSSPDRVWGSNGSDSYLRSYRTSALRVAYAVNADTVDGVHANQLCRIYTFNVHDKIIKVGTLTSGQYGHVCKLRFNSGIGYNASNQDKAMTVVIRASNGNPNDNGFYFEAHSESYRGGAFTTFYLHQTSKTQCELYMAAFNYSGQSTYEVSFSAGDSWTNETSHQNALPTSSIFTLPNYQIAYSDYNIASATKLATARKIWGQSFDGTADVDNTLRIRKTTGNYCEGIRIQTGDGVWSTIILGATADSGTNTNAWSIHRKSDNNFAISRNSSDGANGLVMTSTGMGLGTTSPTQRLDVNGNIRTTGDIYITHATNSNMNYNTSNPRIVFSESGTQAVGLVYTDYDSYRPSKGLKVMDTDNVNTGNVWFEVQGYNYSSGYVKNGGNENQLLRADGGVAAFNWTGQSGQPTWLWGGNDFNFYYVYNPSNFRVAYAASAGNADTLDGEHAGSFVRAGHYESQDLNKLDTYSFIRSVNSNNKSTSPKGNIGWYNVIQAVHRNGQDDGPSYIGQIALGMTVNTDDMFFRGKRTDPWKTVIHSGNISSQTVANAYHLRINSANSWSTWNWSGQSGQPSWLWGSNDGTNMYVWNPSNFNVNTAQYLRSLGNKNCQTGRTQAYGDVYTYNTHSSNTGSATTYSSVIGFGRGVAGTVEIAGGWCNTNLYWRSLKDCCEDWFAWRTVLDDSNYASVLNNTYLPLAGGTMKGNARIGHGSGSLYIGNSGNDGWLYVQDMASQAGEANWKIYANGFATFKNLTVNGPTVVNGSTTLNSVTTLNGLVTNNRGILPASYDVNKNNTACYVWGDAMSTGVTAITDALDPKYVSIHYSNDNGSSWSTYHNDASNTIFNLYANNGTREYMYLGYEATADELAQVQKNQLMVTFEIPNNLYSQLCWASIDMGNGVQTVCTVEIIDKNGTIKNTFTKNLYGWNNLNYINFWDNNSAVVSIGQDTTRFVRFKFKHDASNTDVRNAVIHKIRLFSFTKHSININDARWRMAYTGHLYKYDKDLKVTFPGAITCNALEVDNTLSITRDTIAVRASNTVSLKIGDASIINYGSTYIDFNKLISLPVIGNANSFLASETYTTQDGSILIGQPYNTFHIRFLQGRRGQLFFIKISPRAAAKVYVDTVNCRIIRGDNFNVLVDLNKSQEQYGDGKSRFFIFNDIENAWYEFYCS